MINTYTRRYEQGDRVKVCIPLIGKGADQYAENYCNGATGTVVGMIGGIYRVRLDPETIIPSQHIDADRYIMRYFESELIPELEIRVN